MRDTIDREPPARPKGTDYGNLSMTLGALSLAFLAPVLSPLAIAFGIVALTRRREAGADRHAVLGIVFGVIGLVIFVVVILVYLEQAIRHQGRWR